ncbi:hypothetical protein G7B40_020365 [Aetokthonos hydrillicola Thurmond2011]|jgi:hypothetical protein|uniref:Uncharacterized protein n=2 Tax=Aetokthonos TaxID=1550243 RepID=A0AAP5I8G8_9CYAN|nr:hypothetical protein [Aetokthonos hydrillicola CCALA 1050]MDR9896902.1 hypothetical protein [Aetokthonos hydrillicola Thurmond2011]
MIIFTYDVLPNHSTQQYFNPIVNTNIPINIAKKLENPAVEIRYVTQRRQKPPHVNLLFDITLRNHHSLSRWFIIPSNLTMNFTPEKATPDGLEVFELKGSGRVVIGRVLGIDGFQALLLPAGAEIRIRNFPISFWGELPQVLSIDVITATRLSIGDQLAETRFGINPTSDPRADVREDKQAILSSRDFKNQELPVSMLEEQRFKLNVNLVSQ